MKLVTPLTLFLILAGAVMIGIAFWRGDEVAKGPVESLVNFQTADTPLALPADGRLRFHPLDAWQLAMIPVARRFDFPMGSESGGLTYNAQPFGEMNEARGGPHLGDDLNGIGGMNSDLGDPVFAAADGLVVFSGTPSPGWGKVIVVAHRDRDERILQSMYAHLERIDVPVGALVSRGQRIGLVGTAEGRYPAHLHFEIRTGDTVEIGGGYGGDPLNRLDPGAVVAGLRGAADDDLSVSPLPLALGKGSAWNQLELSPEQAEKLGEILGR